MIVFTSNPVVGTVLVPYCVQHINLPFFIPRRHGEVVELLREKSVTSVRSFPLMVPVFFAYMMIPIWDVRYFPNCMVKADWVLWSCIVFSLAAFTVPSFLASIPIWEGAVATGTMR